MAKRVVKESLGRLLNAERLKMVMCSWVKDEQSSTIGVRVEIIYFRVYENVIEFDSKTCLSHTFI